MLPEEAIARLDAGLAANGEVVTLRRETVAGQTISTFDLEDCPAMVRDYRSAELVGNLQEGDSMVIVSPTFMIERQWCWPPKKGDRVLVAGRMRTAFNVIPFRMGETLVRFELQIRG